MTDRIIGISGKMGAGKNTLADSIERLAPHLFPGMKVMQIGFADLLKEVVIHAFKVPREWAFGTQEDKNRPLPTSPDVTVRDAFQRIGMAFRGIETDYWVRRTLETIEVYRRYSRGGTLTLITDVRFPNEVGAVLAAGGTVIRLTRSPYLDVHPSETALDGYDFPCVIDNLALTPQETTAHAVRHLLSLGLVSKNF